MKNLYRRILIIEQIKNHRKNPKSRGRIVQAANDAIIQN